MSVVFEDYSDKVKKLTDEACIAALYEAAGEIASAAADNSRVDSGQLRGSWAFKVDESKESADIGSPLENALWEEFGTGEYAAKGDGRKGGWSYQDDSGNWHHTTGKKPNRTLFHAFTKNKNALRKALEHRLKGL